MRKTHLLIAAGAAVIFCGCNTKPVTGNKPVIPAPIDDPAAPMISTRANNPDVIDLPPQSGSTTANVPEFEPLTGAISTGGIETAGAASGSRASTKPALAEGNIYKVKRGDTPERIARRFRVRLSALMKANNLDEKSARRLRVGQKLVIPQGSAAAGVKGNRKPAVKPAAGSAAPVSSAAALEADGTYKVRPGDSPERIARRFRVRLAELLKANNLDEQSARRLKIGQKLVIPQRAAATPVVAPVAKTQSKPPVAPGAIVVEEKPEVTPPVSDDAIKPVADTDGTNFEMMPIKEDISLEDFAKRHNFDPAVLRSKNSGKNFFKRGDIIFIPKQ